MKRITRREALKLGALAGGAFMLPIALQRIGYAVTAGSPQPTPFQVPLPIPPVLSTVRSDATTDYYEIVMHKAIAKILPGLTTELWTYNGI